MRRRAFLRLATTAAMGSACAASRTDTAAPLAAGSPPERFLHGVESGDPLPNGIVLWTRVSVDPQRICSVGWFVAEDPALEHLVVHGNVTTDAERDHTVKVDVRG